MADPKQSAEKPPKYHLRTVLDFASVPPDRLDICLREFASWLTLRDVCFALMDGIAAKIPDEFVWVDDDLHVATLPIVMPDGKKTSLVQGVIKGFDNDD